VSKKNMGSSIDDFLKKENIFEEAQAGLSGRFRGIPPLRRERARMGDPAH